MHVIFLTTRTFSPFSRERTHPSPENFGSHPLPLSFPRCFSRPSIDSRSGTDFPAGEQRESRSGRHTVRLGAQLIFRDSVRLSDSRHTTRSRFSMQRIIHRLLKTSLCIHHPDFLSSFHFLPLESNISFSLFLKAVSFRAKEGSLASRNVCVSRVRLENSRLESQNQQKRKKRENSFL